MENEKTNKEKIIIILKESIKFARNQEFKYDCMFEKHNEVSLIKNLNETIKQKIELFNNLNEESTLFKSIFDCSKIALRKLIDDQRYNYYSAELIMKFNQLETIFTRRLKPIGTRIVEKIEKEQKYENYFNNENELLVEESNEENIDIEKELIEIQTNVDDNVTGKKLHHTIKKKKDIISALKETNFNY